MTHELDREITAAVALCRPDGTAAPEAIGWSRRPVHRCVVDRPWGRRKRWHYWAVVTPAEIVSLTVVDLDYAGAIVALWIELATGRTVRDATVRPRGWPGPWPEVADRGDLTLDHRGVAVELADAGTEARLHVRGPRLQLDVEVARPATLDTLGVAVARSPRRFAYSAKHVDLPARGAVTVDGARRPLDGWACLDWGRGVWPARSAWNWACGAGTVDGRRVGLNLGARWTDGGGATENAVIVDGHLTKLAQHVDFAWDRRDPRRPWRLRGDGVDVTLTPDHVEATPAWLRPLGDLRVAFGRFAGHVGDVRVDGVQGWAEELHAIW